MIFVNFKNIVSGSLLLLVYYIWFRYGFLLILMYLVLPISCKMVIKKNLMLTFIETRFTLNDEVSLIVIIPYQERINSLCLRWRNIIMCYWNRDKTYRKKNMFEFLSVLPKLSCNSKWSNNLVWICFNISW